MRCNMIKNIQLPVFAIVICHLSCEIQTDCVHLLFFCSRCMGGMADRVLTCFLAYVFICYK